MSSKEGTYQLTRLFNDSSILKKLEERGVSDVVRLQELCIEDIENDFGKTQIKQLIDELLINGITLKGDRIKKCDFCEKCTIFCPVGARKVCGKEYTAEEVIENIARDKAFYDNSGGGVTFSGGECMLQLDFLSELLKKAKEKGIHTAVDTAGHVPFESFQKILPYTDLFLYDLKCIDTNRHKEYVGVGNEMILENLAKLLKSGKDVIVRIPVIPGVNDSHEDMHKIKIFFETNGNPQKVELLPYHAMGENKYCAIGKEATVFSVPESQKMNSLKAIFEEI